MIRFENGDGGTVESFFIALEQEMDKLQAHVEDQFRTFCYGVFHHVVNTTPQWTGNAAANWNVSTGSPDTGMHIEWLAEAEEGGEKLRGFPIFPGGPFQRGHEAAVKMAEEHNAPVFKQILLTDTVYVSNSATNLDGESYIMRLEQNPDDFLRPENKPGEMVKSAILTFDSLNVEWDLKQINLPYGGFSQ